MHSTIYKINKEELLYSTGNYILYLVIIHNEKESKKEKKYIKPNHFAAHQKLTQH